MTRKPVSFPLTPNEQDLLSAISFDLDATRAKGIGAVQRNGTMARQLFEALTERGAIPSARLQWFTDPECFPGGRGASHKSSFAANAGGERAMMEHPSFLKYLKFFLCGPTLPEQLIGSFAEVVKHCEPVTSGDVETFRSTARAMARTYGPGADDVAEEFFKLCLELGLRPSYARSVRDAVKEAMRRK